MLFLSALFIHQNIVGILPTPNDVVPLPIQIVNFEKDITTYFSGAGIPELLASASSSFSKSAPDGGRF